MIGIIGAKDEEVELYKARIENPVTERVSGIDFLHGRLMGEDVVVARCGVGKVFAAVCAQTMIVKYGVSMLVNSGVSGSLNPDLHIGDVVVATACVQHDMDSSPLGDPVGLVSGINRVEFPASEDIAAGLEAACRALNVRYKKGIVASGDQFIASNEKRRWIVEHFGAISSEMEAAAVAHVAYINDCPYGIVRVISDEADGEAGVDFPTFLKAAAKTSSDVVLAWLGDHSKAV